MYYQNWEELRRHCPVSNGLWEKALVYEYLVFHCHSKFSRQIDAFFRPYAADGALADLLFSFLLDEDYDGSDCQMGAARILAQMDRETLRERKNLLLQAQANAVLWKRPFPQDPDWLWL